MYHVNLFEFSNFYSIYINKSNHRDVLIKVVPKHINIWSRFQLYLDGLINFISIWVHMIKNESLILSPIIGIILMSLIERKCLELNETLIDANRTSAAGCWLRKKGIYCQCRQWLCLSIHSNRVSDVRNRQIQCDSRFSFPQKIIIGSDYLKIHENMR